LLAVDENSDNAHHIHDIVSGLQTDIDSSIFRVTNPDKTAMSHVFFPASRAYFAEEEDKTMLAEFWEFDRK